MSESFLGPASQPQTRHLCRNLPGERYTINPAVKELEEKYITLVFPAIHVLMLEVLNCNLPKHLSQLRINSANI